MKKAFVILAFLLLVFVLRIILLPEPTPVQPKEVETLVVDVNMPRSLACPLKVEIMDFDGNWVSLQNQYPDFKVKVSRRVGHGPAVQLRLNTGGLLAETFNNYAGDGIYPQVIRQRFIEPGDMPYVIAGANAYLNNQLIYQPNSECWGQTVQVSDLSLDTWPQTESQAMFASVQEIRAYGEKNRCWMIITGWISWELLEFRNRDWVVCDFSSDMTRYRTVYAVKIEVPEADWPTGTCASNLVEYRYISGGSEEVEYGPGIVSLFGWTENADAYDLEQLRFVKLAQDGTATDINGAVVDIKVETMK